MKQNGIYCYSTFRNVRYYYYNKFICERLLHKLLRDLISTRRNTVAIMVCVYLCA